jgi:hypothetical protein
MKLCMQRIAPVLVLLLAAAVALPAAAQSAGGTLVYRKVFKESSPEFVEIRIRQDGTGTYDIRQIDDEPDPQPLQVNAATAGKLFELTAELNHFRDVQLDTHRKIANLGQKTFRFERGSEAHEVSFNYTVNSAATQLLNFFEGLSRQQEHMNTLERRVRYDRLGVNEALLRFEIDLNRKILPEPERLVPVLERIANDARMIEMTRHRARGLVERIRNSRPS